MIRQILGAIVYLVTFYVLCLHFAPPAWSPQMWLLLGISLVVGVVVAFLWGLVEGFVKTFFSKREQKVILVDMDGVLADWDHAWDTALDELADRAQGLIRSADRTVFNLFHGLTSEQKLVVTEIMESPGFYRNLPIIEGAKQALKEMLDAGYDVRIVTSPWVSNPTCASDKMAWVVEHLGHRWAQRMVITTDKTLVRGDWLIDDKPDVKGSMTPTWEHIYFDAPLNRSRTERKRIIHWSQWKEVIEHG